MKTFWDKIACLYDLAEFTNKSVNDQMAKAVENEIPQGALVLDCAAGTGALSMAAAKNAKHVTCTDMSKEMLIESMKKARRLGIYNISFAKRDMTALKDPDNRYDAVIAGNVIHLLDDPQKAFSELIRVTKPGGSFTGFWDLITARRSLLTNTSISSPTTPRQTAVQSIPQGISTEMFRWALP